VFRNQSTVWAILGSIGLLFLLTSCSVANPSAKLTEQHGLELRTTYENYKSVVALALETGDTSQLADVAIGYELDNLAEMTGNKDAKTVAEWWKVEVLSITVTEYLTDTAEAVIQERVLGNIARPEKKNVWIVEFQQDDHTWKVSGFESYFKND